MSSLMHLKYALILLVCLSLTEHILLKDRGSSLRFNWTGPHRLPVLSVKLGAPVQTHSFHYWCPAPGVLLRPRDSIHRHAPYVISPAFFINVLLSTVVSHALVMVYQLLCLNVAINSYDNALLSLLISNQFVEIKGSVFKKFEKDNLFQITCAGMSSSQSPLYSLC